MATFRSQDLTIEGSYYIGTILSAVIYGQSIMHHTVTADHVIDLKPVYVDPTGIYLGIYCLSIHALIWNTNTTRSHRNVYILFSSVLLLLNTLSFVEWPYTGQVMWIKVRDSYPGGPLAFYGIEPSKIPVDVIGNVAQTLAATLNDGLLVSFLVISTRYIENAYPSLLLLIKRHIAAILFLARDYTSSYFLLCALSEP
jgi:hypothetical protein